MKSGNPYKVYPEFDEVDALARSTYGRGNGVDNLCYYINEA